MLESEGGLFRAKQHLRVIINDTFNLRERDYGKRRFHQKSRSYRLFGFRFSILTVFTGLELGIPEDLRFHLILGATATFLFGSTL